MVQLFALLCHRFFRRAADQDTLVRILRHRVCMLFWHVAAVEWTC